MTKLIRFVKQEAVLSVAAVLAVVSAFFVPPDGAYLGYIDYRTLAILFSLMTVMAGLRQQGVFDRMGRALLALTGGTLQLVLVLVGLCFFGSMFITNDVSLLTFVPFAFVVLDSLGPEARQKLILPVVCMQTIGANLGSMLTPIGNPQNLYLYGRSGMGMGAFVALMLPYTLLSLGMLAAWAVWLCRGGSPVRKGTGGPFLAPRPGLRADRRIVWMDAALFVVCLLAVMRAVPYGAAFAAVLAATLLADRATLARVDYSLLLTFVAFFLFIGNLGRGACLFGLAGAGHRRAGGAGVGAGQPGDQQCAGSAAAVRLHPGRAGPDRGHQPGGPGHPDRLHGQPDLLPADRPGRAGGQRQVLPPVHGVQPGFPGGPAGAVGAAGVMQKNRCQAGPDGGSACRNATRSRGNPFLPAYAGQKFLPPGGCGSLLLLRPSQRACKRQTAAPAPLRLFRPQDAPQLRSPWGQNLALNRALAARRLAHSQRQISLYVSPTVRACRPVGTFLTVCSVTPGRRTAGTRCRRRSPPPCTSG